MTPSEYLSRNALAINNIKPVLKLRLGPAIIVTPGRSPPSTSPDKAMLIAGTEVVMKFFGPKNLDSFRSDVSEIVEFLRMRSLSDDLFLLILFLLSLCVNHLAV